MAEARFDPGGFYQFDLREGSVRTKGGDRVLVLSDTVLAPLVSAAAKSGAVGPLVGLGNQLGTLARQNLGSEPQKASPEDVVAHASAVVSLFGWGTLAFAHWGEALVVTAAGAPALGDGDQAVGALLTGLISALGDQPADCVPMGGGQFIVVAPGVADQVRSWVAAGSDVGAVVGRLGSSS